MNSTIANRGRRRGALCVLLCAFALAVAAGGAAAQSFPKLAPYAALRYRGEAVQVELEGAWCELRSIDGLAAVELMAFCRRETGGLARKRFAEDLVEMMTRFGHAPGDTVDLVVRDLATGRDRTIERVAMTHDNRQAVRKSWQDSSAPTGDAPARPPLPQARRTVPLSTGPALSPFLAMRRGADGLEVCVDDDEWFAWLAIDGVATAEVVAWAEANADDPWKRLTEDLPAVLTAMGHTPGGAVTLQLRSLGTGRTETRTDVPMTAEKRRGLWRSNKGHDAGRAPSAPATASGLAPEQWRADLRQLRTLFDTRFAYRHRGGVDLDREFARSASVLGAAGDRVDDDRFALEVQRLVARFGDGHAGVRGFERVLATGWTPFLLGAAGDRVAAFAQTRDRLLDDAHPFAVAIDGRPLGDWLAAVAQYVPQGSLQYRQAQGLRLLRFVQFVRGRLGLPHADAIAVTLADDAGATVEVRVAVAARKPLFGSWPQTMHRRIDSDLGYLRLASMDDAGDFLDGIDAAMRSFADTRGLVVDVRGNRGGSRDALRRLLPYLLADTAPPRVVNVAKARLWRGEEDAVDPDGHLANRFLHPANWSGWSEPQRTALIAAARAFRPEWQPPAADFSDWHYMVVDRGANPKAFAYGRPVVVLQDGDCFSATDVFLGALQGLPGVTLLGTASGGGSARSVGYQLERSGVQLRLASMASFRPDGRLYDGSGIAPDVVVEPSPGYFVGREDPQLAAAVALLRRGGR